MAIKISWQNEAGELDSVTVESPADAPEALAKMVLAAGELQHGDKFVISDANA